MIALKDHNRPRKTMAAQMQLRWVVMLCAVAGFTMMIPWYFSPLFGQDQILYLIEAARWLHGAEIYGPRIVEVSLPLIIWVSAIPVTIAGWIHRTGSVDALQVLILRLMVMAMIAGSMFWSLRVVRRSGRLKNGLAMLLWGVALLAAFFGISPFDFGQREHLLMLLMMPYLLAVALRVGDGLGWTERLVLGLLAGLSLWFKPFLVLVPLALEVAVCARDRSVKPIMRAEFLGLVAGCFAVLGAVIVTTPLYFKWIPIIRDAYWAYADGTTATMARQQALPVLVMVALVVAAYILRARISDWTVSVEFAVCGVAASVAYDIQRANWPYHLYPARMLMGLAVVWFALDAGGRYLDRLNSDERLAHRAALVLGGALAAGLIVIAVRPKLMMHMREVPATDLETYVAAIPPGNTVWVMSTSVMPIAIVYRHDLRWGSRFACLWLLPAVMQSELGPAAPQEPVKRLSPQRLQYLAHLQRTDVAEDLAYWKPTVVAVQQCTKYAICQGIGARDVDLLAWFMQSPQFRQQWAHYRKDIAGDGMVFFRRVN